MAVYSRGGGTTTSQSTTQSTQQLMSRELGTIIVRTLETVQSSLSGDDVPVSYKDVEKAVTQGVNKSDLVKKGIKGGNLGQTVSGSAADKALAEKYEQDKYIKWQEWQKKLQKEDERNREELKQRQLKNLDDMKRKVDETWSGIATAIDNPLKGISNLLDNTIKDFSSGFLLGMKNSKDKRRNGEEKGNESEDVSVGSVTPSPELKPITDKLDDLNDLITDNFDDITGNQETQMSDTEKNEKARQDELSDLITDDKGDDDKQKSDEQKANEADKKKRDERQLNATQSVGYAVGNVVGSVGKILIGVLAGVAVGSQLIMFVKGKLYKMLEESPAKWDIRIAKIQANLESIPDRIKLSAEQLLGQIKIGGKSIFAGSSLNKDEENELKTLEKNRDIAEYKKSKGYVDEFDTTMNETFAESGIKTSDYNLNTTEGKEQYKQAILTELKNQGLSDKKIAKSSKELDNLLLERDVTVSNMNAAQKRAQYTSKEDFQRYLELDYKKNTPKTEEYYQQMNANIDAKAEARTAEILSDKAIKRAESGEYTQTYKAALEKEGYAGAVTMAEQKYEDKYGEQLNTAPLTERETWLKEKYEPWENAWKDFGKNMKLDMNIETQRPAKRNALNTNGNQ